jgi:arsenate reductase
MPKQQALDLYGIVNCDQVKKARVWLAQAGREVTFHDFKKEPPSKALLDQWLKQLPWDQLVNRRGTTWRQRRHARASHPDHTAGCEFWRPITGRL